MHCMINIQNTIATTANIESVLDLCEFAIFEHNSTFFNHHHQLVKSLEFDINVIEGQAISFILYMCMFM